MKALTWGDTLCGQEVDNYAYDLIGWIVQLDDGSWDVVADADCDDREYTMSEPFVVFSDEGPNYDYCGDIKPIFPPRGWAGKTDAELWEAVFGGAAWRCHTQADNAGGWVSVRQSGLIEMLVRDEDGNAEQIDTPQALILALQNAAVLSARLREAQP